MNRQKAHQLLSSPDKWTRGTLCVDAAGKSLGVPPKSAAVAWDLSGAIYQRYGSGAGGAAVHKRVRELIKARHSMTMFQFNDRNGYEEVVELLKELDL